MAASATSTGSRTFFDALPGRLAAIAGGLARTIPVKLLHADGTESVWIGDVRQAHLPARPPRHVAVEFPDDYVLHRRLVLPRMSLADLRDAAAIEVRASSPFPADDLAWGLAVAPGEGTQAPVDIAIASRRQVASFLAERWPRLADAPQPPEVWVLGPGRAPIVLPGYGESRRASQADSSRRLQWALALVAAALLVAVAMTPTLQLRARAIQAVHAMDLLHAGTASLVAKREEIRLLEDRIQQLDAASAERLDPAAAMELLTQALPDDTFLHVLELRPGGRGMMAGQTGDAAALLQKLTSHPGLREVRSPGATSKVPGSARETFVLEFLLAGKVPLIAAAAVTPAAAVPAPSGPNAAAALPFAPVDPAAVLDHRPAASLGKDPAIGLPAEERDRIFRERSAAGGPVVRPSPSAATIPADPVPPPAPAQGAGGAKPPPPPFVIGGSK